MEFETQTLDYILPEDKIASFPLPIRHHAKLLVYQNNKITHGQFLDLANLIETGSLLVFNDTKVFHARMHFITENDKSIEVFCLEPANGFDPAVALAAKHEVEWICMLGGAKKWKSGKITCSIFFNDTKIIVEAKLLGRKDDMFHLSFKWENSDITFAEIIETAGELPLPPYMNRKATSEDERRYQTVYAKQSGSVAAPTAGLHFTEEVMQQLALKKISNTFVTLHVGAGTFKPIKSAFYHQHQMHEELIDVKYSAIEDLLNYEGKIIAVGTTSLRTIESLYWMGVKALLNNNIELNQLVIKQWEVYQFEQNISSNKAFTALLNWMKKNEKNRLLCKTQIMITPKYQLKVAEGLITNFHQPKSTLLLLIAAVCGNNWEKIYDEALKNNYRFLSYGDSSLLMKNKI
jgi:S-adenosylmethionine:tRNA ribosyltransferase-isomerase